MDGGQWESFKEELAKFSLESQERLQTTLELGLHG